MNRFLFLILLTGLIAGGAVAADQCLICHQGQKDKPSALFRHDIHFQKGVTCAGCHGGNAAAPEMDQAMNPDSGFTGVPTGDDISAACARCHADSARMKSFGASLPTNQFESLKASIHGHQSTNGKERILQCTSCHGAHGIVAVKDPASPVYPLNVVATCTRCHADPAYMRNYNPSLAVDQLEKYRTSVHGTKNAAGDPKVAECASCHGSHNIRPANDAKSTVYAVNVPTTCARCHADAAYMKPYGIPTDQFDKYSTSVHGIALLQKHDVGAPACNSCHGNHGATPPGVSSVSMVCGTCHALNADLFSNSPHKKAFDAKGLPECETCHRNHDIVAATDLLLGTAQGSTCSRCHAEGEKAWSVAGVMKKQLDSLRASEAIAQELIHDAEQKGMEVSEDLFKLRDVHQAVLQARTVIHAADQAKFMEVTGKGLAQASAVIAGGREAIHEYSFRRWGLGIATLIISIVAISLYLLIRRMERNQR